MGLHTRGACTDNGRGEPLVVLGFSPSDLSALMVARSYFKSFGAPEGQSWLAGIGIALNHAGSEDGPHLAVAVLCAVQTMRRTRQSCFRFNCPDCDSCAAYITSHERNFMATLRATAKGNLRAAEGHAMILCEGNDTTAFLKSMETLAEICTRIEADAITA